MASKYEISTLANDIGVFPPKGFIVIFQNILLSRSEPLVKKEYAYTLGACFDVKALEDRYRGTVVEGFESFVTTGDSFNMLVKWCPHKLLALVKDAMAARTWHGKRLDERIARLNDALEHEDELVEDLITKHCWKVKLQSLVSVLKSIGSRYV